MPDNPFNQFFIALHRNSRYGFTFLNKRTDIHSYCVALPEAIRHLLPDISQGKGRIRYLNNSGNIQHIRCIPVIIIDIIITVIVTITLFPSFCKGITQGLIGQGLPCNNQMIMA